jgi:hypothetical protein
VRISGWFVHPENGGGCHEEINVPSHTFILFIFIFLSAPGLFPARDADVRVLKDCFRSQGAKIVDDP